MQNDEPRSDAFSVWRYVLTVMLASRVVSIAEQHPGPAFAAVIFPLMACAPALVVRNDDRRKVLAIGFAATIPLFALSGAPNVLVRRSDSPMDVVDFAASFFGFTLFGMVMVMSLIRRDEAKKASCIGD